MFIGAICDVAPFFLLIVGTVGMLYGGLVTRQKRRSSAASYLWSSGSSLAASLSENCWCCASYDHLLRQHSTVDLGRRQLLGVGDAITEYVASLELTRQQYFLYVFLLLTVLG